jgi:7-cyano-7-deazaguanine synthase
MKAVTLLSGGLDSTTLAYKLKADGYELHCLSFDYGQRHLKELEAARAIAHDLGAVHHTIQLRVENRYVESLPLASVLGPSVLVDQSTPVPDGHYADENMKQTVVPNRNAIMLSIAYGVAMAEGAQIVAFAAHSGDHRIYPDCRPEFVEALSGAFETGAAWDPEDLVKVPIIKGPFLFSTKGDIATLAQQLGVPIAETWSCYKGGDVHCGTCGTCYERREALDEAERNIGIPDPTVYLDSTTMFEAPADLEAVKRADEMEDNP